MKKNLNVPFVNWKGETVTVKSQDENGNVVEKAQMVGEELGALCFNVFGNENLRVSGEEKLQLYRIATAIGKDPANVEMSAEDIVLLKRILEPALSAGAYGQVVGLLEG